jgi:cell division protein FtsI/penicillin-binding protein 2
MAQDRESPQEKKKREYGTRVTSGNRRHATARKKEKKNLRSETRSKEDELLSQIKPELSYEDAEVIAGELTSAHLQKSVTRKHPQESSAAPFSQVIEWQSERRKTSFGRKTKSHPLFDARAKEAVETLNSVKGEQFIEVARRAGMLCNPEYESRSNVRLKPDIHIDRALHFLCRVIKCSHEEI